MKATKSFNNISAELQKLIPKLKPGQEVVFQMLNGVKNPDPDPAEQQKNPILYGRQQLRTNFRIYDEHLKNEDGETVGGFVDVGAVDRWDGDKPERFRFFMPGMGEFSRFQGKFSLTGGNAKDEELYEILWLSPEREGSPCADSGTELKFRIVDAKSETKHTNVKVQTLMDALEAVKTISEEDARGVFAALNQPTYQDKEVLMAKIRELAASKPEDFMETYKDPDTKTKSEIKEAVDSGVVKHDPASGEVKIGDVVIATIKVKATDDFVGAFVQFVKTAQNGKDVLSNIRAQMKKKSQATT